MNRLNLNQTRVLELRAEAQAAYPDNAQPLPGSNLKLDDDILWCGFAPMRVVWGYEDAHYIACYSPDIFGESIINVEGAYINDRTPADPKETPMPIYPPQQLAQQPGAQNAAKRRTRTPNPQEVKAAIKRVLAQLPNADRQRARAYIRQHHADIELPPDPAESNTP